MANKMLHQYISGASTDSEFAPRRALRPRAGGLPPDRRRPRHAPDRRTTATEHQDRRNLPGPYQRQTCLFAAAANWSSMPFNGRSATKSRVTIGATSSWPRERLIREDARLAGELVLRRTSGNPLMSTLVICDERENKVCPACDQLRPLLVWLRRKGSMRIVLLGSPSFLESAQAGYGYGEDARRLTCHCEDEASKFERRTDYGSRSSYLTAELPRKSQPSRKYTLSGSPPDWAATEIRFRSPRRRSPASKTCCWARFPACPRSTCTIRCSPMKTATTF